MQISEKKELRSNLKILSETFNLKTISLFFLLSYKYTTDINKQYSSTVQYTTDIKQQYSSTNNLIIRKFSPRIKRTVIANSRYPQFKERNDARFTTSI